ncbi:protein of unknown function [Rhodovastum atsumiense]|nr:protein of unknown function [Rhodovastum atsumiense]
MHLRPKLKCTGEILADFSQTNPSPGIRISLVTIPD